MTVYGLSLAGFIGYADHDPYTRSKAHTDSSEGPTIE
eukprot:SAG31_NODE_44353_length_263_cov_0.628049_1_plen_36_part_10